MYDIKTRSNVSMAVVLNMSSSDKIRLFFIIGVGVLALLFLTGSVCWYFGSTSALSAIGAKTQSIRENSAQYKYINPLLYSETSKSVFANQYAGLVRDLNSYISSTTRGGSASSVSVYYRDLNSGHWTGVNEDDMYRPSSMLKVLVLMSVMQVTLQNGKGFLSTQLDYKGANDVGQYFKPQSTLSLGHHNVSDLVNAMIGYSDNGADAALMADDDIAKAFDQTYSTFKLPVVSNSDALGTTDFMSAREYSGLFRALYNGAFFPESICEQVLDMLTKTTFVQGLVAGVPNGVVVAHKFGEDTNVEKSGTLIDRELHDCGIFS